MPRKLQERGWVLVGVGGGGGVGGWWPRERRIVSRCFRKFRALKFADAADREETCELLCEALDPRCGGTVQCKADLRDHQVRGGLMERVDFSRTKRVGHFYMMLSRLSRSSVQSFAFSRSSVKSSPCSQLHFFWHQQEMFPL